MKPVEKLSLPAAPPSVPTPHMKQSANPPTTWTNIMKRFIAQDPGGNDETKPIFFQMLTRPGNRVSSINQITTHSSHVERGDIQRVGKFAHDGN